MRIMHCLCLLAAAAAPALTQVEVIQRKAEVQPSVFVDVQCFASEVEGKSHVDTYLQVPYDEIKFVKEGDQYVGRYEVTVNINNLDNEHIWDKDVLVEVRVRDFAQTSSSKLYSLRQIGTELYPGVYELTLQVQDQESKKEFKTRRKVAVPNFRRDSLMLSDIMLVTRVTPSGDKTSVVPNISGTIGESIGGFYLYFELYNKTTLDSIVVNYSVINAKQEVVSQKQSLQTIKGRQSQVFFKVDSLRIPIGVYTIRVDAFNAKDRKSQNPAVLATTSRSFSVRWSDVPFSITDIEKAVEQMRYIAKESEIDLIRDAETVDEKRERFLEFWRKRDPDPQTARNELMDEYYSRVEQANQMFGTYYEGWKSDRGMVFIRYGPPDNVERHPFELNSHPYEIWYYYQKDMLFQFIDQTGFGDYRLVYPQTDLWGRVR